MADVQPGGMADVQPGGMAGVQPGAGRTGTVTASQRVCKDPSSSETGAMTIQRRAGCQARRAARPEVN